MPEAEQSELYGPGIPPVRLQLVLRDNQLIINKLNNMYIIINKTKQTRTAYEGSWPVNYLEQMLEKGDRVIVISTYSNTIKVPYFVEYNGIKEWDWENYSLDVPMKTV